MATAKNTTGGNAPTLASSVCKPVLVPSTQWARIEPEASVTAEAVAAAAGPTTDAELERLNSTEPPALPTAKETIWSPTGFSNSS